MSNWIIARWKHAEAIGKTWWFLFPALWGLFWSLDESIEKWNLLGLKVWWDKNTTHLPKHWETWLAVLLVLTILGLIEGSFRYHRGHVVAHAVEIAGLNHIIEVLREELRLERDRSKPELHPLITQVSAALFSPPQVSTATHETNTLLVLGMAIENTGAPSIVKRFSAQIEIRDEFLKADIALGPPGDFTANRSDGKILTYSKQDYLPIKAYSAPIPTGGGVHGWLRAVVRYMHPDDVWQYGTLHLSFYDVQDREYKVSKVIQGIPNSELTTVDRID
jgi:hypothetical protein